MYSTVVISKFYKPLEALFKNNVLTGVTRACLDYDGGESAQVVSAKQ